VADFQSSSLRS